MKNRQIRVARFRKLLVASGLFNIALTSPLIPPGLHGRYIALLGEVNAALGLGGQPPVVPTAGPGALLVNTAGIGLVLVGVFVVYAAGDPLARWVIPAVNAVGRALFAAIVVAYVATDDLVRVVLVIGIFDVVFAAGFVWFLLALRPWQARAELG
jgi:hypothetical protein